MPWKRMGMGVCRSYVPQYQPPGTGSSSTLAPWVHPSSPAPQSPVPTHAVPLALIKPLINRLAIRLRNATLERAGSAAIGITAISRFKEAEDKLMAGPLFNTGDSSPGRFWSPMHTEHGPAKKSSARDELGLPGEEPERGERSRGCRAAQSRLSLQRAGKRLGAASSTDTMQEGIFQADAATKAVKSSQVRGFRG